MRQFGRIFRSTVLAAAMCVSATPLAAEDTAPVGTETSNAPTKRVLGIGGLFFRAEDPKALAQWYRDNLGIDLVPSDYETQPSSPSSKPLESK